MRMLLLLPAVAFFLAACQSAPKPEGVPSGTIASRLEGNVFYLQRIALDPAAVITIRVMDVTDKSQPPFKVAELTIGSQGRQVPIPFAITYDAAPIQHGSVYILEADIHINDTLRWRNAQTTVLQGIAEEHVELLLAMTDDAD